MGGMANPVMRNEFTWDVLYLPACCHVCNGRERSYCILHSFRQWCLLQTKRYPRPHAPTKVRRATEAVAKAADLLVEGSNAVILRVMHAMTETPEIWTQHDHVHRCNIHVPVHEDPCRNTGPRSSLCVVKLGGIFLCWCRSQQHSARSLEGMRACKHIPDAFVACIRYLIRWVPQHMPF